APFKENFFEVAVRAIYPTSYLPIVKLRGAGGLSDQFAHRVRRFCASLDPMLHFFVLESNLGRLEGRIISPKLRHETSITRRTRIRDHNPEKRFLAAAVSSQPDY